MRLCGGPRASGASFTMSYLVVLLFMCFACVTTVDGQSATPSPVASPTVAIPFGDSWSYRSDGVAEASTDWTLTSFDSSSWLSGSSPLGYGLSGTLTALPYGVATSRYVTVYFRKKFTFTRQARMRYYATLDTQIADGAIVYLNGMELGRKNMPAGTAAYATLASSQILTVTAANSAGTFDIPDSAILSGDNYFAVEVHKGKVSSPYFRWNAQLYVYEIPPDSASPTVTPTVSKSPSKSTSPSRTATETSTPTETVSPTASVTPSDTATGSHSASDTATESATVSPGYYGSPMVEEGYGSDSSSETASTSETSSMSPTPTRTKSVGASSSNTPTSSVSESVTGSGTASASLAPTASSTSSVSESASASWSTGASQSSSQSLSETSSITATSSVTGSVTNSVSQSSTPSLSLGASASSSQTISVTSSSSVSPQAAIASVTPTASTIVGCLCGCGTITCCPEDVRQNVTVACLLARVPPPTSTSSSDSAMAGVAAGLTLLAVFAIVAAVAYVKFKRGEWSVEKMLIYIQNRRMGGAAAEPLSPKRRRRGRSQSDYVDDEAQLLNVGSPATPQAVNLRPLPAHLAGRVRPLTPQQLDELRRRGILPSPGSHSPRLVAHAGPESPSRTPSPTRQSPRIVQQQHRQPIQRGRSPSPSHRMKSRESSAMKPLPIHLQGRVKPITPQQVDSLKQRGVLSEARTPSPRGNVGVDHRHTPSPRLLPPHATARTPTPTSARSMRRTNSHSPAMMYGAPSRQHNGRSVSPRSAVVEFY